MARKRRFFFAGVPAHVVQRGNNRQAVFFDDRDYRVYLDWPGRAAGEHRCSVYAYALMTNHVHVLMTAGEGEAISATWRAVRAVNQPPPRAQRNAVGGPIQGECGPRGEPSARLLAV